MWWNNTSKENHDSDQSISEEEGLAPDWTDDCISLGGPAVKKEGILIQSQLQILRDTCDQRQTGLDVEDDVEIPVFQTDSGFLGSPRRATMCRTDKDIISNEKAKLHKVSPQIIQSQKRDMGCTWSAITKEAEGLFLLNENTGCLPSKLNKLCQGSRGKVKPKFSFHLQSRKVDFPCSIDRKDEYEMPHNALLGHGKSVICDHGSIEDSKAAELLENFHEEDIEQTRSYVVPGNVASGHNNAMHSMAEILDGYQEKHGPVQVKCKKSSRTVGRRGQFVVKRNASTLGNRNNEEDELEALDSGSSSEDEGNVQKAPVTFSESKGKAMVDQFQEILGAAGLYEERALFALPRQSKSIWKVAAGDAE